MLSHLVTVVHAQGDGAPMDASREQRFKAQIAEYESMLKQTWEDKAALSKSLEAEREKILCENHLQQQMLEQQVSEVLHCWQTLILQTVCFTTICMDLCSICDTVIVHEFMFIVR